MSPPLVLFEDDHLLVILKPAGWSTHAPALYAGEGAYEWLRDREPRWATLGLIHRLDKETSGVMVFGKTSLANRSLTQQFERGTVRKSYVLLTDRPPHRARLTVRSALVRVGERYQARPLHAGAIEAVTRFTVLGREGKATRIRAEPLTGRTHQIRVHAASEGFPVLGDRLYGGGPAPRLCLHAQRLSFHHPVTGALLHFEAPADFASPPVLALRTALITPEETNACRLIHGAADGWPGWRVDRLGDYVLTESPADPSPADVERLQNLCSRMADRPIRAVYHKRFNPRVRSADKSEASPCLLFGEPAPPRFQVMENGLTFALSFEEGYSTGLFLDQRDNRRRLLTGYVASGFSRRPPGEHTPTLLNTFAYTCAFSVSAARGGWHTTSLDLSRKYLEWGRHNFALNGLDPASHDFIYGDVFDWLKRLARKGRAFDAVVLDPPTFSQSKSHGVFRAEADYPQLVRLALPLIKPHGWLLACTNAARYRPEAFVESIEAEARRAGRAITARHYAPQPPDFPISREDPAHFKSLWLQLV